MIKKFFIVLALSIGLSVAGMVVGQTKAFACTNSVCGYFNDVNESAWCNVLPDPSIRWGGYNSSWVWTTNYPSYCWLNTSRGNGHSTLYGVTDPTTFKNRMSGYLWEGSGTANYIYNSQVGAAFLIDDMMGTSYHNGNSWAGVTDARNNWGNWTRRIDDLAAASQCYVTTQPTCPGKTAGINWGYVPQYFCNTPWVVTSGYDPWINDTPFYTTGGNCDHDWRASIPEIVFFWVDSNGIQRSFHIGSQCGNVQESGDPLPPPNNVPSGTLSLTCDPNSGQQTATITVNDADGATNGYIVVSGTTYNPPFLSGGVRTFTIPISSAGPFVGTTVALYAKDVGPLGSGGYNNVANANTIVPCATFSCGTLTVTSPAPPLRLDPFMQFSLTVTIGNSVGLPPTPNPNITLSISSTQAGQTYSYGPQSLPSNGGVPSSATFSGLPQTNKTGRYRADWRMTVSGVTTSCSGTFDVVYLPYVNIYGGDAMIGASPTDSGGASSTCNTEPGNQTGAYSWNNHTGNFSGAGAQYAVMALYAIRDFASAQNSSSAAPRDLSFANVFSPVDPAKLDTTQGLFGGYFGDSAGGWTGSCDFTSDIASVPVTNADLTIPATTVSAGTSTVYHVVGGHDVYISGNITYGGAGGWADPSQIPSFRLVVTGGGHIYIGSGVTQLDGLYVSEPTSAGAGGNIYTCASAIRIPVLPTIAGYYTTCNQKLTINGAFVARQVWFGRTNDSLGHAQIGDTASTSHAAEVFNYTPELWLPRSSSTPNDSYAAIIGLPPVL